LIRINNSVASDSSLLGAIFYLPRNSRDELLNKHKHKMKIEAVVHPTSISRHDARFDSNIHIPIEVLDSLTFRRKMIGLPVTAYHHDTMKAVNLLSRRKQSLTGPNMTMALQELHQKLPTAQELAKKILLREGKEITPKNVWTKMFKVTEQAGGPGVMGKVTKYWRDGQKWMVAIDLDNINPFQKKLVKMGGALGDISLTHAVINNVIEPLEVSLTIQGLRTGSSINRIVSASSNTRKLYKMLDMIVKDKAETEEVQAAAHAQQEEEEMVVDDPVKNFYNELEPSARGKFKEIISMVTTASAASQEAGNKRLQALEESMDLVQRSVVQALDDMPAYFGNMGEHSAEQWKSNPASLATANQFILAAAANSYKKRKRDTDDVDKALDDISTAPRVVAASSRQKTRETAAEDEFFKELRNMRAHLRTL